MNEDVIYTVEYDETIPTRERDGVVEHKHTGIDYWHPVSMKHGGCGRTDGGVEYDVRMCSACDYVDNISMCHGRRRELGLGIASVAHYVSGLERTSEGVVEHIHDGYRLWHSVDILHFGCRRVADGKVLDSIMCCNCACFDIADMCSDMREKRGMNERDYFSHKSFAIVDERNEGVDEVETLMLIDEVVSELVSANSMLGSIGRSDHVQYARFEQFTRKIDVITLDLLKISMSIDLEMDAKRMEAKRNEKNSI